MDCTNHDFVGTDQWEVFSQTMERVLPNLRQKLIIDGAGHWVQQEQPAEVSRLLVQFLQGAKQQGMKR